MAQPHKVGRASTASFPQRVLAAHNLARAEVGQRPLIWDDALGRDAAKYALQLAATGTFAHSSPAARHGYGENLWMGTRHAFSVEAMMEGWASEKRLFVAGVFPAVGRKGGWQEVGHYTQMIWPTTQRVGCALVGTSAVEYLVCRYYPAGNVIGTPLKVMRKIVVRPE
jgi:hypothetical protein